MFIAFYLVNVHNLLLQDRIIISLTSMDAKDDELDEHDPLLVVHPDYVIDQ